MFELEHPRTYPVVLGNMKKPVHVEVPNKSTIKMEMSVFVLRSVEILKICHLKLILK